MLVSRRMLQLLLVDPYRKEKLTKSEIVRRLGIGRTSVRRLLEGV